MHLLLKEMYFDTIRLFIDDIIKNLTSLNQLFQHLITHILNFPLPIT